MSGGLKPVLAAAVAEAATPGHAALRLDGLAVGDRVEVYGEYEWNEKGGLIHWTHKDPAGKHAASYVEWRGAATNEQ